MENLWNICKNFGILLDLNQSEKINKHFKLLIEWNAVHNLTTIQDYDKIFLHHYVDCFLGLKILEKNLTNEIYDLGSGAGFPGLMAAVLWPEKNIFLVESSSKKQSFLSLAVSKMELNRVKILGQRAEYLKNVSFAITRAAFSFQNWKLLEPILAPEGKIAFWLSGTQLKSSLNPQVQKGGEFKNSHWVLESLEEYELEPGNKRQIAVFHVKH